MTKCRKILTSAMLAAVMAISIAVGAAAEENESEITEAGSIITVSEFGSSVLADTDEYFVLEAEDGSVSLLQKDLDGNVTVELNGVETILSEDEFLKLREAVGGYEILCDRNALTSGGTDGQVNIRYGVYAITRNPVENVFQAYYGVFAQITNDSTIITDLSVDASFDTGTRVENVSKTNYGNSVYVELYNAGFINVRADISSDSSAFGKFEKHIGYNFT